MSIKYTYKDIEHNIDEDNITLTTAGKYLEDNISINTDGGLYKQLYIPREVTSDGKYIMPESLTIFNLSNSVYDVGEYVLDYSFHHCMSLESVDLSSLTNISGKQALRYAFNQCLNLTSVDLSNLVNISGEEALSYTFAGCANLSSVDLSNLTNISGRYSLSGSFNNCTSLASIDLSHIQTISSYNALNSTFGECINLASLDLSSITSITGEYALNSTFYNCTSLTSVDLSRLTSISGSKVFYYAFNKCTSLAELSFPSLTSKSFGLYTNQFDSMLNGVKNCTVHFPSQLVNVIGEWSSIASGFGGTNTTVLFDLPATEQVWNIDFANIPENTTIHYNNNDVTNGLTLISDNESIEITITLLLERAGYLSVSHEYTVSGSTTIDIESLGINWTQTEIPSTLDLHYDYTGNESILSTLVDGNNFIISNDYEAIISGPSSYNVNYGTSYGYINILPKEDITLSITAWVDGEYGYDFGGIYVGTKEYKPNQSAISNGDTDGAGSWLLRSSYTNSVQTYSQTLIANTLYYINFCYVKDSSGNGNIDRLIITDITAS